MTGGCFFESEGETVRAASDAAGQFPHRRGLIGLWSQRGGALRHRLAAGGKIGTGAVGNAEVIASGLGCFCGSCYLALSYRKRILLLGLATGVLYYLTWTFIGVLGYTDVSLLDGMRSLIAAVAGGERRGSCALGCCRNGSENCLQSGAGYVIMVKNMVRRRVS